MEKQKAPNERKVWVDCTKAGRQHRFELSHQVGDAVYWQCQDCPVRHRDVVTVLMCDPE
jgi:hypothetical protein